MGAFDVVTSGINALANAAGLPSIFTNGPNGALWQVDGAEWYKVFGYQFCIIDPSNENEIIKVYTLPIPPQQLTVAQQVASQATATIGGVVEETSETVFWTINMTGTTGLAVSRGPDDTEEFNRQKAATMFREVIGTTGLLAGIAGSVNSAVNKVGSAVDAGVGAFESFAEGDIAGGIGGVVGAANTLLLPPLPYSSSAVSPDTNGYTEIQELSKFFYLYNQLKAGDALGHGLMFKNFKDGQQFRCIVKGFNIQKSAQQPYLYRYQIQLQAWGVQAVDATEKADVEFDRFGPKGDLKAVNTVGLNALNLIKGVANNVTGNGKNNSGMFLSNGGSII